jgi:RNA polymerase sigma-70 factor (ECF subfamily)
VNARQSTAENGQLRSALNHQGSRKEEQKAAGESSPPSKALTGPHSARAYGLRAYGVFNADPSQIDSNDGDSHMLSLLQETRDYTNNEAWCRLVSMCKPLLCRWLRRHDIQRADAEDLVQETLATLALEAPAFQSSWHPRAFRCWLYKVLTNRLRDFRRSQRVRSICRSDSRLLDGLADFVHDYRSNLKRQLDHDHDSHVVRQAMERIEPEFQLKTWQAFRRVAIEGADPKTVAAELNLSLDSVYAAKSRILRRLRQEAKKTRLDASQISRSCTF